MNNPLTRRPALLAVLAVLAALAISLLRGPAGGNPLKVNATAAAEEAAVRLGRCTAGSGLPPADPVDPVDHLAGVERWLEVGGFPDETDRDRKAFGETEVLLTVRTPGDATGKVEPIYLSGAYLEGLAWGVDAGSGTYLALRSTGSPRETVTYAIVKHHDGTYFFPGDCAFVWLTKPLRERLGDRYGAAMAEIIGKDGAGVRAILEGGRPSASPSPSG